MKRVVSFLITGLLLLFGSAIYARCLFVKTLGGTGNDLGYAILQTSDGKFVIAGYTEGFGAGSKDILLSKLPPAGKPIWTVAVGGSDADLPYSLVETYDGGLVLTGYTRSFGGSGDNMFVTKFDSNGNHVWTKVLTDPGGNLEFRGYSVIEDSNNDLVVTGYMYRNDLSRYSLLLAKFSSAGAHLATRSYYGTFTPNYDHYGYSVVEACNGDYVVVGSMQSPVIGEDILLARFQPDLDNEWGWWIGEASAAVRAHSIIRTSECEFAIVGAAGNSLFISKRDTVLNPMWQHKLMDGSSEGHSVIETFDGGFVASGGSSGNVLLAKWSMTGTPLWVTSFGDPSPSGTELGLSLVEESDPENNLLVVGNSDSWGAGQNDLLLAGCDYIGRTCLPDLGGPGSAPWNPAEDVHYLSLWTPVDFQVWPWSPTVTPHQPAGTSVCAYGTKYVVCADGSGDFPTIQDAIDACCDGDTIELCDGTFWGSGNRDISFRGKAITVRSQNGADACTLDCVRSTLDAISPHRCFMFVSGEGPEAVLEGITCMNGVLFGPGETRGGGILCVGSSPTVTGCRIIENSASGNGGGICCVEAAPQIVNCLISGNSTGGNGGGICCESASPAMTGCVLTGNWADGNGGGTHWSGFSSPRIYSCTFSANSAQMGGGLYGQGNDGCPENTIVWGDSARTGLGNDWYGDGGCLVECCNCLDPAGLDGFATCVVTCSGNRPNTYDNPWFCCPETTDAAPTVAGDYTLCPSSICSPEYSPGNCGLIGALDVGTCPFRGDCNGDSTIDIGDAVCILNYLFKEHDPPDPLWIVDVQCSGLVDLGDPVYVLNWLFKGGRPPCCYCP